MTSTLDAAAITTRLAGVSGWIQQGSQIRRTVECPSFPAAIALVTQVGFLAEAAAHHPDIDIRWRKVTFTLTTHDAGGLTARDFDLAQQIDAVVG
jgi:4a-hydroxytetrahydrobiopterin dehydratase